MASMKGAFSVAILLVALWSVNVEGERGHHGLGELFEDGHDGEQAYHHSRKPAGLVEVNSTIHIRMLGPLCLNKSSLHMQIVYRETFFDSRIPSLFKAHGGAETMKTLTGDDVAKHLWTPDTFFSNSIEEELLGGISENAYARIHADGKVCISRRLQLTIYCPKLVKGLKAKEKATCGLTVASYGYHNTDIVYKWGSAGDPVKISDNAGSMLGSMKGKDILMYSNVPIVCHVTSSTGEHSCITANMMFALDNGLDL